MTDLTGFKKFSAFECLAEIMEIRPENQIKQEITEENETMPLLEVKKEPENSEDDEKFVQPPKLEPERGKSDSVANKNTKKLQLFMMKNGKKVIVRPVPNGKFQINGKTVVVKPKADKEKTPESESGKKPKTSTEVQGAVANITSSSPLDLRALLDRQFDNPVLVNSPIRSSTNVISLQKVKTIHSAGSTTSEINNSINVSPIPSTSTSPSQSSAAPTPLTNSTTEGPKKRGRKPGGKNFADRVVKPKKRAKIEMDWSEEGEDDNEDSVLLNIAERSENICKCEILMPTVMRQMKRITNRLDVISRMIGNLKNHEEEKQKEAIELFDARNEIRKLQNQITYQKNVIAKANLTTSSSVS